MSQTHKKPLRIIFAGTPEFSLAPLQALLDSAHEVIAVFTQPDRPAGRGQKLTASPVKNLALQHNLPVYQPVSLKEETIQQQIAALHADLMVVVAYGLILPQVVLEMPVHGCLNIHASLLPRWRGAAPIQRSIESGDAQTGVTIMQMDVGLDTGDMLYKVHTPITAEDTAQTLHDRLSTLGATALMTTIEAIQECTLQAEKQSAEQVTYAEKLNKAEAQIDWSEPALTIVRKIQAFNPWPVAFTPFQGQPLRIWQARCLSDEETTDLNASAFSPGLVVSVDKIGVIVATGTTPILLTLVQPAGKKAMSAYDFAQARQLTGYRFQ